MTTVAAILKHKGYRVTTGIEKQRQLGFEIGLNLQQILFDLKVSRGTW